MTRWCSLILGPLGAPIPAMFQDPSALAARGPTHCPKQANTISSSVFSVMSCHVTAAGIWTARFTHRRERRVALKEITDRAWARISTQPEAELMLLDLRWDGCTRIGVPTDTVRARNHAPERVVAKATQETSRNVAIQGDTDLRHHHGRPHRRFRRRDRRADVGHFEPSVQVPPNTPPLIYVCPFIARPTGAVATTSLPPSPGIETVQDPGHLFYPLLPRRATTHVVRTPPKRTTPPMKTYPKGFESLLTVLLLLIPIGIAAMPLRPIFAPFVATHAETRGHPPSLVDNPRVDAVRNSPPPQRLPPRPFPDLASPAPGAAPTPGRPVRHDHRAVNPGYRDLRLQRRIEPPFLVPASTPARSASPPTYPSVACVLPPPRSATSRMPTHASPHERRRDALHHNDPKPHSSHSATERLLPSTPALSLILSLHPPNHRSCARLVNPHAILKPRFPPSQRPNSRPQHFAPRPLHPTISAKRPPGQYRPSPLSCPHENRHHSF